MSSQRLAGMLSTMKPILTITMNPAVDISTDTPSVAPTRKMRCTMARRDAGGGGINVARVIKRLGGDVHALFPAGGPIGTLLGDLVAREGVQELIVPIGGDTRENFTATETATGDQYRFVVPGPTLSETEWQNCLDRIEAETADISMIVASGSLPPGVPSDFYARVAAIAHAHNLPFVLDATHDALKAALGPGIRLIKPNLVELEALVGHALPDETAQLVACRALVADGKAENVALTLGEAGALLVTPEGAWRAAPLPLETRSAVGAGDSFTAGMAWALAWNKPVEEAFRTGVGAGSAAVMTPGTELCHAEDVWRLAHAAEITAIQA
ncbi:1-phosphofructokinase family hexose kinase [Kordiimonas marina]|uniref:1-phosphofructokinase family hexose kinase n=1 Tax=Kordiimonas marina TaxID=2872312 RepID=UPI001FF4D9C5|nr:1-phosphofructokinase family hexose kinase [Kordiimonas marina]MCJ9430214.1 1-phosphofructokinase family hexose kinase [Kordiimonas marina]